MKKLFTKLAGAAMFLGGLAMTSPSDAARVYFDAGDYTGDVYVYVVGGSDASSGDWGTSNCKPCTKVNNGLWTYNTTDDTQRLIFMTSSYSNDNNKLTKDCTDLADGKIYKKNTNADQSGSKYMCFVGWDIANVANNWSSTDYPLLTTSDANKLTYDFEVTADRGFFKFYNASESLVWGASGNPAVSIGQSYGIIKNQNGQFEIGKGRYTITLDLSTYQFTVAQTGETEQPTQPEQEIYLFGDVNNNTWAVHTGGLKLTHGEGYIYTATVTFDASENGNSYFRFYNETSSKEFGPDSYDVAASTSVLNNNKDITTYNDKGAWYVPTGTYTIIYDASNNSFSISGVVPMYLVGDNINGFEGMTPSWDIKEENLVKVGQVIKIASSENDRAFAFKSKIDNQTVRFGPSNQGQEIVDGEFEAIKKSSTFSVPSYTVYELTIESCTQEKVTFSVKVTENVPEPVKNYYFVGDLNNWFSTEFTTPVYKKENGNYVKDQHGNYILEKIGMDADDKKTFIKERDAWKFEYQEDGQYKGWYKFDKFPMVNGDKLLSGQFQICGDQGWNDPEVYSHVKHVSSNNEVPDFAAYKEYYKMPIPADSIVDEADGNPKYLGSYMSKGTGQNFHFDFNGVKNAEIYFKPGNTGKCNMIIVGIPVDYYIFYAMRPEDHNVGDKVTAKITAGKPNTNNYFLPGIKYSGTTEDLEEFIVKNGNDYEWTKTDHMNLAGKDLIYVDLNSSDAAAKLSEVITDQSIIDRIVNDGELPNGMKVPEDNYGKYIYVQKIPKGFENPAGYKYNMHFSNALSNETNGSYTLTTDHMYFIPRSHKTFHVHVNADELIQEYGNKYDINVYYRVYNTSSAEGELYNTFVLKHDEEDNLEEVIVHRVTDSEGRGETALYPVDDQRRSCGWIHLDSNKENTWVKDGDSNPYPEIKNWNVRWNEDKVGDDKRHAIHEDYAGAYVQLKIVYTPKKIVQNGMQRSGSMNNDSWEVFIPSKLDKENDNTHYPFNGFDKYIVLADDGVATGIDGIFDDFGTEEFDGETVAPVYYNLQGVRVENPTNGLYIKVTGSKSEKVLF